MTDAPVLVSADEIPPDAVVCDVRFDITGRRDPRDAFAAGHLPGAVHVDVAGVLSGPADGSTGRHPLPTPEAFAAALGALGVGDDAYVVGVDDLGGTIAARLVWMLRAIGRPASLLDGGMQAWSGGAVAAAQQREAARVASDLATAAEQRHGDPEVRWLATGEPAPREPVTRAPVPWPADRLADLADVQAGVPCLLDARPPGRFKGEDAGPDPRVGHIPGARNAPTAANLRADGTFKEPAELREQFAGLHAPVVSCGSGITACHTLLALELAGIDGRLFPGSFSQWAADPNRPVQTCTS